MESYGRMRKSRLKTDCDYYQEFGFKRKESTAQLRQDVERVRRQWRLLASLSGDKGAEASEKLRLLADAALVFQDDASREAYDQALLSQPVDDSTPIDWIAEARKYYFVDDDDAARAAASKARAVHGNDPQSYVISAWIELREGSRANGEKEQRNHYKRARDHASNAYILDTREENVTDVNYVRGEAFRLLGKHKKAVENYERAFEAIEAGVPSDMAWRAAYSYVGVDDCDTAIELCLEALRHKDDLDAETMEYVQRAYYYAIEHACFPFANEVDEDDYIKDVYQFQEYRPFEDNSTAPLQEFRKELSRLDSKEIPEKRSGNVRTFLQLNIQRLEFMQKRIELLDTVPTISDEDRKLPKVANEPNPIILLTAGVLTIASVFANYVMPQMLNLPIMMTLIVGLLIIFMIWLAVYLSSKDERKRAEKQLKEKTKQADEAYKYADNYGLGQVKAITEKLRRMKR
jgi:hypothetical protein